MGKLLPRLPWYLIRISCLTAFSIQIFLLIYSQVEPSQTVTSTTKEAITAQDYPVVFKICIKPGFNESALWEFGYNSAAGYFSGESRFNESLVGWAGHTADGRVVGTVSGKYVLSPKQQVYSNIFRYTVKGWLWWSSYFRKCVHHK